MCTHIQAGCSGSTSKYILKYIFIEGSLEVKNPTIWTDGKAQVGRVKEEKKRSEKIGEEKEIEERRCTCAKRLESRDSLCFPVICWSRGSKSRLAKAAGAEPSGQMRDEQFHAIVARSTFASKKAKDTSRSEHFWKLRCRKSARCCGAKHISKSKCRKHTNVGRRTTFGS